VVPSLDEVGKGNPNPELADVVVDDDDDDDDAVHGFGNASEFSVVDSLLGAVVVVDDDDDDGVELAAAFIIGSCTSWYSRRSMSNPLGCAEMFAIARS